MPKFKKSNSSFARYFTGKSPFKANDSVIRAAEAMVTAVSEVNAQKEKEKEEEENEVNQFLSEEQEDEENEEEEY